MKVLTMLKDVLGSLVRKPATENYPASREVPPERLRSLLHYDGSHCTGCGLCMKDCPASALELITIDKQSKRFVMRYHADRCTFCAQCVVNCRFGCLQMSNDEWELAQPSKEPFTILYGDEADVQSILERPASTETERVERT